MEAADAFPCGHPRSDENIYVYKGGHDRCRECRRLASKRSYDKRHGLKSNVVAEVRAEPPPAPAIIATTAQVARWRTQCQARDAVIGLRCCLLDRHLENHRHERGEFRVALAAGAEPLNRSQLADAALSRPDAQF